MKTKRPVSSSIGGLVLTLLFPLLTAENVRAAAGDLDLNFGGFGLKGFGLHGKTVTDLSDGTDEINDVALQADGKIVAVGRSRHGSDSDFAVVRYTAAGNLDTNFGGGDGIVTTAFSGNYAGAEAVVIQPDGKIVVVGWGYDGDDDFVVVRYTPDGLLDTTFDGDGKVITGFGDNEFAYAVALQSDEKIVVAGTKQDDDILSSLDNDFALVRYNPDGSLDTTFDGDGKVVTGLGEDEWAYAVAIQTNGRIVVAGSQGISDKFVLTRYNPNGSLDTTFDGDGKVSTSFGGYFGDTEDIAIQPDGKIIAVGSSDAFGSKDFALVRYNTNGSLDTSFGGAGKVVTNFGSIEEAKAVTLQRDGRIVVVGTVNTDYSSNFGLKFGVARYNLNGSLDTSFGNGGKVVTDIIDVTNVAAAAHAVAFQPDGKIVAAGSMDNSGNKMFALARYFPDGSLDVGGRVTTNLGVPYDQVASAVALQSDGKVVAAGSAERANGTRDFALTRYLANGNLDPVFDGDGRLMFGFGGDDGAAAMALQSDGKIVVAGWSKATDYNFGLMRFKTDGSLDGTFGFASFMVTDFGFGDDFANAIAVQPDGKILVAGTAWQSLIPDPPIVIVTDPLVETTVSSLSGGLTRGSFNFAVARYLSNGQPDTIFGGGTGRVLTPIGSGEDVAYALTLQPDGKIIVAGKSYNSTTGGYDFALVRYKTDGTLDNGFTGNGIVTTDFSGGADEAFALTLQSDGKIVVAGSAMVGSNRQFALARYNANGSLQNSFGMNGKLTTDFSVSDDVAKAVRIQADGKIVAAGSAGVGDTDFAVARYTTNGSLDTTFGGSDGSSDGKLMTDFGAGDDGVNAVVIETSGKIIAAGSAFNGYNNDFAVARYQP